MERTSVCILPSKPEIAFEELDTVWVSPRNAYRVEAEVRSLDSHPKYKVRTVRVFKRNHETDIWREIIRPESYALPSKVLAVYHDFKRLVQEVR